MFSAHRSEVAGSDFFRLDIISLLDACAAVMLQASDFFRLDIIQHSISVDFFGNQQNFDARIRLKSSPTAAVLGPFRSQ